MTSALPRRLLGLLRRGASARVILGIAAGTVSGFAAGASVATLTEAIARPDDRMELGWRFAALTALQVVAAIVSWNLIFSEVQRALAALRISIASRFACTSFAAVGKLGMGTLQGAIGDDVIAVGEGAVALIATVRGIAAVTCVAAYALYTATNVAALTLGSIVLAVLGIVAAHAYASRQSTLRRDALHQLHHGLEGLALGRRELLLNAARREAFEREGVREPLGRVRRASWRAWTAASAPGLLASTFVLAAIGYIAVGDFGAIGTEGRLGVAMIMLYIVAELEALQHNWPKVMTGEVALERIGQLDEAARTEYPLEATGSLSTFRATEFRSLEWRDIRLSYALAGGDRFEVGPVSLGISPGEIVFLTGANGAGKSTIVRGALGLHPLDDGAIRLDGHDVVAEDLERFRQLFSYVPAAPCVFDTLPGITIDDEVLAIGTRWITRLGLDGVVSITAAGLSTTDVSSGQFKRLALLAAALERRPVIVLDEWAAEQDPEWRARFYNDILPAWRAEGRAVLAITHDDRYFPTADRVLVLVDGHFTEAREGVDGKANREAHVPVGGPN